MENVARVGRNFKLDQIQDNSIELEPSGWPNDTQLHPRWNHDSSFLELGVPFGQAFTRHACDVYSSGRTRPAGEKSLAGEQSAPGLPSSGGGQEHGTGLRGGEQATPRGTPASPRSIKQIAVKLRSSERSEKQQLIFLTQKKSQFACLRPVAIIPQCLARLLP